MTAGERGGTGGKRRVANGFGPRRAPRLANMNAFDDLPVGARRVIANADYNFEVKSLLAKWRAHLRKGGEVETFLPKLARTMRRRVKAALNTEPQR